jgi:hypothetical protein
MYAHQVIDDLVRYVSTAELYYKRLALGEVESSGDYSVSLADIPVFRRRAELIRQSKKFFLGEFGSAMDNFLSIDGEAPLFQKLQQYLRLPFKVCWFDFQTPRLTASFASDVPDRYGDNTPLPEGQFSMDAGGVLAVEHRPGCISFDCFSRVSGCRDYPDVRWIMSSRSYFFETPSSIGMYDEEVRFLGGTAGVSILAVPCFVKDLRYFISLPGLDVVDEKRGRQGIWENGRCLCMVNYAMLLLNCKNIFPVTVFPSEKLNKQRRRSGKTEGFTYRVLEIRFPKSEYDTIGVPVGGHNRVHLCRGHFKEYTSEKPLFGRIVGIWWWDAYKRGQNKSGEVDKEYVVSMKEPR